MASYHNSFTYLGKNSAEQGFIIAAFKPDDGFVDTFLDMEQIYEDYYDGTKKFLYGTKYNTTAKISISLIKADGTDWNINDNRRVLSWLTGARTASWLDLYQGDEIKYSFLGTVTSPEQYKIDGRIIGMSFEFLSITPWAYSAEQVFDRSIEQKLSIDADGILIANEISISDDGVLCNGAMPGPGANFLIDDDGIIYVTTEKVINADIVNETDDLYSYIYLDIEFLNDSCSYLKIENKTLDEITRVDNLHNKDIINITNKQFIVAYTVNQVTGERENQNRIFGDDFNFIWPRLAPGNNNFIIEGSGNGTVKFSYRYPMKVGDCAMDITMYGGGTGCCDANNAASYNTVRWEDITGTPTSISGYGITDAYTKSEVYSKDEVYDKNETYSIDAVYTKDEVYNKDEVYKKSETYSSGMVYNKNEVYNKDEVYHKDKLYTKTEVDDKIDGIEISGGTGSGSGSVTIDEQELENMLNDILK